MNLTRTLIRISATALLLAGGVASAQTSKDVDELRAEVKRLRDEVAAMKQKQAQAAKAAERAGKAEDEGGPSVAERLDVLEVKQGDAVVAGDIPGSFRVPGTDLSLRLYGFIELNWVHDFKGDNSDIDYSTFAPYMPLEGTADYARKNRDYLTARTSRVGLEGGIPTRFGVFSMKVEGDFNNEPRTGDTAQYGSYRNVITQQATSSYGFRIRHAYGQFAGLLAGMTWSTFMDVDNYPETVDFNGPIGATFIRQPQIRYTYATSKAGSFTVALENSSSYVLDPATGFPIPTSLSRMPDVVLRWDKGFDWGAMSIRGVTQELRVDDGAGATAARRGWGAGSSALVKTFGNDYLTLGVTYGDGIGRYLNYIEGAIYDAPANHIAIEKAIGVIAGYQYKPLDVLRFNLVYGMTRNFDGEYTDLARAVALDSGRFGVNRMVQQAHLGLIFNPLKTVDFGLEGMWSKRETLAGEKGDGLRLNFSAKYYIN